MTTQELKLLAESAAWEQAKKYLALYIEDLDRVSKPLIVKDIVITPEQAYLGKLLAVETLVDFINSVDSFKNREEREKDARDSME